MVQNKLTYEEKKQMLIDIYRYSRRIGLKRWAELRDDIPGIHNAVWQDWQIEKFHRSVMAEVKRVTSDKQTANCQ